MRLTASFPHNSLYVCMYVCRSTGRPFFPLGMNLCSLMCLENKQTLFLLYVENQKTNNRTIPKHNTCISLCADFQHQLTQSGTDSVQLVKDEIEPAI